MTWNAHLFGVQRKFGILTCWRSAHLNVLLLFKNVYLQDKDLPIFDSEAKEDIRKGFRLIEFLHIAPNYQLSTDQMVVLATGRARWIQFDEIM